MRFIDLFSGIGGLRKGFELAGHTCIGSCEKDTYARTSYEQMFNTQGEWVANDINTIDPLDIPKADIWTAGFPCQNISIAGKQEGLDGARSGLYFKVIELLESIEEKDKPSWLVFENVKNLLSVNAGWDFARVLIALDEIGYDAQWHLLNSKDYGVPQNRERVFIIGNLRSRGPREIFSFRRENKTALRQIVGGMQGYRVYDPDGLACCTTGLAGGVGAKIGLYIVPATIDKKTDADSIELRDLGKTTANCLTSRDAKGIARSFNVVAILTPDRMEKRQNGRRAKNEGEPMFTLTARDQHGVKINERIRRLTPKECFRLQGFSDEMFNELTCSDNQLYKQAGNAVTVNVAYEIGLKLGGAV